MFNETSYGEGLGKVYKESKLAKIAAINPARAARLAAQQGLTLTTPPTIQLPGPAPNPNPAIGAPGQPAPGPAPAPAPVAEGGIFDSVMGMFSGIPKNYVIIGAVVVGFFLLKKK